MRTWYVAIPLLDAAGRRGGFALVDTDDLPTLVPYRWTLNSDGYAYARVDGRSTLMHRFLLGVRHGNGHVHHVNENKLDNRRRNLQWFATAREAASQPHPKALDAGERARMDYMRRMVEGAAA